MPKHDRGEPFGAEDQDFDVASLDALDNDPNGEEPSAGGPSGPQPSPYPPSPWSSAPPPPAYGGANGSGPYPAPFGSPGPNDTSGPGSAFDSQYGEADASWGAPPSPGYGGIGTESGGHYPGAPPPPGPSAMSDYYDGPAYGEQAYGEQAYGPPSGVPYDGYPNPSPNDSLPPPAYPGSTASGYVGAAAAPPSQPGPPSSHVPPLQPLPPEQFDPMQGRAAPQTADSLRPETLLRGRKRAPAGGWRRAVYKASGGLVRPGESPGELRRQELLARTRTPVAGGHHRVAVMSLKGGVGKTTTTVSLGSTLAALRGDRVIAVDANPDRGTLSDKVRLETAATVRDLLNERVQIQRYADVRAFTSQAPSRLEVLASDRDPAVSEAFSEDDYRSVAHVLEHFYSICLTDCGTGLLHSAMSGVLGMSDQIVLVSSPSVDGARSASATLDWLEAHDYRDLVRNAVVALSMVRPRSKSSVDITRLEEHFAARCRSVMRIPYDPHLEEGAEIDLEQLGPDTKDAYLQLSSMVGDGFAWR